MMPKLSVLLTAGNFQHAVACSDVKNVTFESFKRLNRGFPGTYELKPDILKLIS